MPTGYTATLVSKGQTFPDFAMLCARNFGATITMRDDPLDAPIPEFEPTDYYVKELATRKAELARLLAMSIGEKIAYGEAKKAEELARAQKWLVEETEANKRLTAMRTDVLAWDPPTSDHVGLKQFMLQQIEVSMHDTSYIDRQILKSKASFARDYYFHAVEEVRASIESAETNDLDERKRTNSRNRWVRELRASLQKQPASA